MSNDQEPTRTDDPEKRAEGTAEPEERDADDE